MTYLLDTCIVSRLRKLKTRPDPKLKAWIGKHAENFYYLSVLTLGEIQAGIARLQTKNPQQEKEKMLLEEWLFGDLIPRFQDRILDITQPVVFSWGKICGYQSQKGMNIPIADGLIAATAMHHGLIVVTDNTKHFAPFGVEMVNPWAI